MAQKVRKAVIPAAGLGTRVLPISKAMPKEMLPIVDKPAIQYIVEEAVASGIEDILIITNRGKGIIEDHFDHMVELEQRLAASGRQETLDQLNHITGLANIYFIRQKETKGLGHAVNCARSFVGNEPFAVLYGDDVIIGEDPACGQLCRAYEEFGRGVVGIKEVAPEMIGKYSSLKVAPLHDNLYTVTDMIEKPTPDKVLSLFSILGRCVLPPEIFDILDETKPGAGGEIQLTDAMLQLARNGGMTGVDFTGIRYDMGNKLGILQATCEVALQHPEVKDDFRAYLKKTGRYAVTTVIKTRVSPRGTPSFCFVAQASVWAPSRLMISATASSRINPVQQPKNTRRARFSAMRWAVSPSSRQATSAAITFRITRISTAPSGRTIAAHAASRPLTTYISGWISSGLVATA